MKLQLGILRKQLRRTAACPRTLAGRLLQNLANALEATASGSKFFVLRMAFMASMRSTASTRSSAPAANAALISS